MQNNEKGLSFFEHIVELRKRLTRSVIVVGITTVISFIFYRQIFVILTLPAQDAPFVFIELTEMVGTVMRVCLASGIILAIPYLTYEVIMFVSPALTEKEKRYVYLILPWITLMFVVGVVFGYFVLVPPAMKFLLTFGTDIATPQIKIGNYISIVTRLLLVFGLVFELPVVITFLARLGVVTPKWLADKRKIVIILIFVASAIITPTVDPINQLLVAVPMILLYEISILLSRVVYRRKQKASPPD